MQYTKKKFVHTRFWSFSTRLGVLLGGLFVIAVVSVSVYYTNQQRNATSNAAASTTLSFSQSSLQINQGSPITLDVAMNPGSNFVSLVTLVIDYDSSAVTPDTTKGIVPNTQAFPSTLDGPTYNTCHGTQCTMSISLSVGSDPTKAIKVPTTVATVNFLPVSQNGTTQLAFDNKTQVFSIAPGDQANENVLSTTTPAIITIGQGSQTSITPFPQASNTPTPTQPASSSPTPTTGGVTPTTGGPTPTSPIMCKERDHEADKDIEQALKNARQKIDNLEDKLNNLVKHKNLSKVQKMNAVNKMQADLTTTEQDAISTENQLNIGTNTNGGCVGNFDPNNPNVVNDCNHPNAVGNTPLGTFWQNIVNKFQSIFGHVPPTQ